MKIFQVDLVLLKIIENNFDCSILNEPINDEEIIKSVRSTKNNKSPGPDGINAEMYKETLILILPYLSKLFNAIFDSGFFPENWRKSIITPVFKKGSKMTQIITGRFL